MRSMPKIAVFGCGYWGKNHVRTLAELGALACIVDQDENLAKELAQKHGVDVRDAQSVFADPAIDGITMALPAQYHAETARQAFAAGKHVFAEKPIALDVRDAQSMVDAAQSANRVLMAGHILCHHNAFRAIVSLIEDGALGDIKYVQSHRLGFGKFHTKFDAAWDLAPHDLSLILSIAKSSPIKVDAVPVSVTDGQTDSAHIHLAFENGMKGHVFVSRHSAYVERRFSVIGTKASVVWDDLEQDWNKKVTLYKHDVAREGDAWRSSKDDGENIACEAGMALTDELGHFIDCIKENREPLTNGRQGLEVVKILNTLSV
ncbi:Gfo/Idh/MocA family oxidoreductase [Ahrensia kielensis]|uniref:Gfo/Idh/MocA family oxidoreductase n=1 Tax=Ahrensia kielensis TaxID=76980 RepID=A0ABU9T638_9HYPH